MLERMKPYLPTAFLFLLIVYFGVQALTGEKGLLGGQARAEMLQARQAQLEAIDDERRDLEVRVRYLRSDSLSRDLLEERARAVLGFTDPRDYVIRVTHEAPVAAKPSARS